MSRTKEINRIVTVIVFIFCSIICFSPAGANEMTIRFDGDKMSAEIEGVLLRDVFKKIKAQKKFNVRGDDSVLNDEVSVKFNDLSFEAGLKKILGHINHILFFNRNKEPSGVLIVGSGGSRISVKKGASRRGKKVKADRKKPFNPGSMAGGFKGPTPASEMPPPTEEELASMKIIKNAPTPGGPVKISEEEMENLKIMKNSPPPGGVVKVTPEELERMTPTKNSEAMPNPGVN